MGDTTTMSMHDRQCERFNGKMSWCNCFTRHRHRTQEFAFNAPRSTVHYLRYADEAKKLRDDAEEFLRQAARRLRS